jgi:hypothetical protein
MIYYSCIIISTSSLAFIIIIASSYLSSVSLFTVLFFFHFKLSLFSFSQSSSCYHCQVFLNSQTSSAFHHAHSVIQESFRSCASSRTLRNFKQHYHLHSARSTSYDHLDWSAILQIDSRSSYDSDKKESKRREWENREERALTVREIDEKDSLMSEKLDVIEEKERERERIRQEIEHERRACRSLCLEATEDHFRAIFFRLFFESHFINLFNFWWFKINRNADHLYWRMIRLMWLFEILLYSKTHHFIHMFLTYRDVASFMKFSSERKFFCSIKFNIWYIVLLQSYLSNSSTTMRISLAAFVIHKSWMMTIEVSLHSLSLKMKIL